ncbi:PHD-finger domain-containing protein [Hirsutella rhossiliensis]|uniref:PHD-finger domain-containing protein n=1 Tax=Hirsutella rhossiliensis TaxID=111463 RepID=A0A9P8N0L1_9HYPO|nr:PHD-finger domain-containing protein [Hirsutella rhossiliensis]KAH0965488.1 PHD-finger domain-containing protein [Hirsutella rhossiliensis]
MTDKPAPLPTQTALPSQTPVLAPAAPVVRNEVAAANAAETVEEEPYTIKCICNFSDDDGNTIYCETCDTWQHIDCFYPNNRDEAIREDFAHSCAECKPRPLDRQKAIERTLRLRNAVLKEEPVDKKSKRPPSKSHKKKAKPADLQTSIPQGSSEAAKHGSPSEQQHASKKAKSSHRPSHSVSSQPSKRSPSYGNPRPNLAHPPSPATTPPDLPDDFQIHHYSAGFCSLYNEQDVPDTHNNAFASLAIPTALSRWLREPDTMKQEVGRTHAEVFQTLPANADKTRPKLEVKDSTRSLNPATTLRWRSVKSTAAVEKDVPIIELNGEIGFQKDYCVDPDNLWADLSSPLPFVFFHPILPLYIDTRKEGSLARYVRRSCKPNAQLDTYLSDGSEYHFWLVSDRYISASEQITLPWDFRLEKSVHTRWLHLLGLSDDDLAAQDEPELDASEYTAISNWIDRILSEYGGCACDLDNNCAFARFHRHYLFGKNQGRSAKKRSRKSRNRTISPTSTSHATNSRAASEGHVNDNADIDAKNDSNPSRSKPPSRDRTPLQGQFDQLGILTEPTDRDKRKVAMVEDSFRRMEQQQPPRKKKRVSDGAVTSTSTLTKPKSRNGSAAPPGRYADAGTSSRSKSDSPLGQDPAGLRPTYCDVSVQTDTVEGEWFSESCKSQANKKRIISLSKRLLNSRLKNRTGEEGRKRRSLSGQTSAGTVTDVESPTADLKPSVPSSLADPQSPKSQSGDVHASDSPQAATAEAAVPTTAPTTTVAIAAATGGTAPEQIKIKTPDLRVQMPPVPTFDGGGVVTTPLSASSTTIHSPIVGGLPSPFAPPAVNGIAINPSPIKKKLSLSDYTKSRMNKAAGKMVGGSAVLKPGLASPEEIKVDVSLEPQPIETSDEVVSPSTSAPATNGL